MLLEAMGISVGENEADKVKLREALGPIEKETELVLLGVAKGDCDTAAGDSEEEGDAEDELYTNDGDSVGL